MNRLKIAIQKSGRLSEDSLELLKECGLFINNGRDQLIAQASNFPLDVLYLRNADIPKYIKDGVADVAILGDNTDRETRLGIKNVMYLGFSKCRLSIAVPRDVNFTGLEYLQGKKIATSYPNTLQRFLDEKGIDAEIHVISGSVEISPNIGLADAICDIVSTGSTLLKNGLKEVYEVCRSEAAIFVSPELPAEKQALLDRLLFRIQAVLNARNKKYLLLNAREEDLDKVCEILSGCKSPTIMSLKEKGWFSVHSVIDGDEFWETVDKLKEAGAEGILSMPIEKIIP